MSKREKILLAATLMAALYGGLSLFVLPSMKTKSQTPSQPGVSMRSSSSAAEKLMNQVLNLEIEQPLKTQMIAKIQTAWQKDPFVQPEQVTKKQADLLDDPPVVLLSGMEYSGYIIAGGRTMAVINGTEYGKGDTLLGLGYQVVHITPEKVVVQQDQNMAEILFNRE
jgi:hypothetical protein